MNGKNLLTLIAAVSLSLSGCTYKTLAPGYDFEAQVVTEGGSPKLIVKCTPTESVKELAITDDIVRTILRKLAKVDQTDQPDDSESSEQMKEILDATQGNEEVMKMMSEVFLLQQRSRTYRDAVLNSVIVGDLLPCPPGKKKEQ